MRAAILNKSCFPYRRGCRYVNIANRNPASLQLRKLSSDGSYWVHSDPGQRSSAQDQGAVDQIERFAVHRCDRPLKEQIELVLWVPAGVDVHACDEFGVHHEGD